MEPGQRNPPLGALLAVMTLAHVVSAFGNLSIPPLTPFLRDELNLTHAEVGLLMSFIYIGVVSASLFFGWITDLLGERRALTLGLGIQGIFMIIFAWVHTFLLGGFLLLLSGIGYSSVNPATTKGDCPVSTHFRLPGGPPGLLLPGLGYAGVFLGRGPVDPDFLYPREEII